jgi:WhiB family redox-sensing transcriptional regulator
MALHNLRIIDTDTNWLAEASCKGKSDLFFGHLSERPSAKAKREKEAAAICATCAVATECRDYARRNNEHGFWGGENEDERYLGGFLKDTTISRRIKARNARNNNKTSSTL